MKKRLYSRIIPLGDNFIVKRKGFWGIVNKDDVVLLPIEYMRVHRFEGGYAGIQKDNLWGLSDTNGNITINPQYDFLLYYDQYNGCEVETQKKRFVVDVNNQPLIKLKETDEQTSADNIKRVRFCYGKLLVYNKNSCQLYNLDGTTYSKTHPHIFEENGLFIATDKEYKKETIIKENGKETKMPHYEHIGIFENYVAQFRDNGKFGVIDVDGNVLLPSQYDFITLGGGVIAINDGATDTEDFLKLPYDGEWYFLDYKLKPITQFRYDKIRGIYMKNGYGRFARREGQWFQITPQGEALVAMNDEEYEKKRKLIERQKHRRPRNNHFGILQDTSYTGEGRKLYVIAKDGKIIRKFYYTPYLPMSVDELECHHKIGEYIVNEYGQDIPNPHAFKMPKEVKRERYVFKHSKLFAKFDKDYLFKIMVTVFRQSDIKKQDAMTLLGLNSTKAQRVSLLDWMYRRYKRNKKIKFDFYELTKVSLFIMDWVKKDYYKRHKKNQLRKYEKNR